jgi:hypothetical protein
VAGGRTREADELRKDARQEKDCREPLQRYRSILIPRAIVELHRGECTSCRVGSVADLSLQNLEKCPNRGVGEKAQ